jgi:hypothetical protein
MEVTVKCPPPIVHPRSLPRTLADLDDRAIAQIATIESARVLASALASVAEVTHEEAMRAICQVPDNVSLQLLESPAGWALLSEQASLLAGYGHRWIEPSRH